MVVEKRDTVVVEGDRADRRPSYGWLIALIIVVLLIIAFFAFGGVNMFRGGSSTTNVQVQPSTSQPTTQP